MSESLRIGREVIEQEARALSDACHDQHEGRGAERVKGDEASLMADVPQDDFRVTVAELDL